MRLRILKVHVTQELLPKKGRYGVPGEILPQLIQKLVSHTTGETPTSPHGS